MQSPKFENKMGDLCLPFTFDIPHSHLVIIDSKVGLDNFSKVASESVLCGIDTETKPHFNRKKEFHPTALIQIALRRADGVEFVFLLDLLMLLKGEATGTAKRKQCDTENLSEIRNTLDTCLQKLFSDKNIIKVGQRLHQDLREMRDSYPKMEAFKLMCNVIETNTFHRYLQPEITQNISLKNFTRIYLNFNLVKKQQLSNWGNVLDTHYETTCCITDYQPSFSFHLPLIAIISMCRKKASKGSTDKICSL